MFSSISLQSYVFLDSIIPLVLSMYCCKTYFSCSCIQKADQNFSSCPENILLYWNMLWHFHQSVVHWAAFRWEIFLGECVHHKVGLLFWWFKLLKGQKWRLGGSRKFKYHCPQKEELCDHNTFYAGTRVPTAFLLVLFFVLSLFFFFILVLPGLFHIMTHGTLKQIGGAYLEASTESSVKICHVFFILYDHHKYKTQRADIKCWISFKKF